MSSLGAAPTDSAPWRTLAALLASALGTLPLCQLLSDRGWLLDVWLSMAIVIAPAFLIRTWGRAPGALQVWPGIVALVPWLTVRFVPRDAWLGFVPTRSTWHQLAALMTDLHRTTRDGVAPVHSTIAIKLALCAMLGLLAALVDLIAVVGRHGALAGVPLLVVFTISGAVPKRIVDWQYFVLAAIGFMLLLALDARDDLSRWGHRVPRPGQHRGRATMAISGPRIAAVSIAVALVVPVIAPRHPTNVLTSLFRNKSGGDVGGFGALGGGGSIDPFAALKGQLVRAKTAPLATVTITGSTGKAEPFYLRENVLSDFVGTGWAPAGHGTEDVLGSYATIPSAQGPNDVTSFTAQIHVTNLTGNAPVFAVPSGIGGLDGLDPGATWSAQDQLVLGAGVHRGEIYTEQVGQPQPTTGELAAAPTSGDPSLQSWTRLPTMPAYVGTLVGELTQNAASPWAKASAISNFFLAPGNHFRYSLSTAAGDSGNELVDFLHNRIGYCQQYAAAMAVMLRLAGMPARVVLGYTHAAPDASGTFTITTDDAHAWVEAFFEGIGWVPFDPTPLAGIPGGANDLAYAVHTASPPSGASTAPANEPTANHSVQQSSPSAGSTHRASASRVRSWLMPALVIGIVAILFAIPWLARRRRRGARLRAARGGDPDPLWAELSDTATDLGYVWSPVRTPRQVARWLQRPVGDAADSLRALADAVEQSRYGPGQTAVRDRDLAADLDAVTRSLRALESRSARFWSALWPASLGWTRRRWRRVRRRR